ncbi:MAG: His/Gly/Thr/Pro-type tRNA ligase C-terminal domain-containing protein, partial [Acholeplasmatales bacterium]|nr:His/Gly/Thr/Pro-type tRNA ligase C-terminal domain-containing protein [Acholeplasmatales bacterium]
REVLKIHPYLAPYKVAVLPLIKNKHQDKSLEIYDVLSKHFSVVYDETQNIGKRYRRQDQIGTPYCLTVDEQTLIDNTVTIRERDSMNQIRLQIDEVMEYIKDKIRF